MRVKPHDIGSCAEAVLKSSSVAVRRYQSAAVCRTEFTKLVFTVLCTIVSQPKCLSTARIFVPCKSCSVSQRPEDDQNRYTLHEPFRSCGNQPIGSFGVDLDHFMHGKKRFNVSVPRPPAVARVRRNFARIRSVISRGVRRSEFAPTLKTMQPTHEG